jgi:zinc/manganese transport system permease protein
MSALAWAQAMLAHEFMRNALVSGTAVALASGLAGYFLVLRGQVFAADALSHVAFTGALGALAFGLSEILGLFAATVLVAVLLSLMARGGRASDIVIGSFFAWIFGVGVLFISIYVTSRSASNGIAGVNVLFGSIFGIGILQTKLSVALGAAVVICLLAIARPLLIATIDANAAVALGVRAGWMDLLFLILVAAITAEAVQIVGALLVLGLVATPAAIARHLTLRPYRALGLSAGIALGAVWIGLTLSYTIPHLPPSFAIIGLLFAAYVALSMGLNLQRRLSNHAARASG